MSIVQPNSEKLLPAYPLAQVARFIGCSPTTLRAWLVGRKYVVRGEKRQSRPMLRSAKPGECLTFLDLVEAHILQIVRKGYGIPMKHYRAAVEYLHSLGNDIHFLAHKDFVYDKRHFYLRDNEKLLSLSERGQYIDTAIIDRGLKQLLYGEDGYAEQFFPKINGREQTAVMITPKIGYGQPTLARLGVNVDVIATRFDAGEHMKDLAADYGATPDEIEEALRSTRELVRVH